MLARIVLAIVAVALTGGSALYIWFTGRAFFGTEWSSQGHFADRVFLFTCAMIPVAFYVVMGIVVYATAAGNVNPARPPSQFAPPLPPSQTTGFTALELAAIDRLTETAPDHACTLRDQLAAATVVSRVNTGAGCLTRLEVHRSALLPDTLAGLGPLLFIEGIGPAVFTAGVGQGRLLGFELSAAHDSSELDWAAAPFHVISPDDLRAHVEQMRTPDDEPVEEIVRNLTPRRPVSPPLTWLATDS